MKRIGLALAAVLVLIAVLVIAFSPSTSPAVVSMQHCLRPWLPHFKWLDYPEPFVMQTNFAASLASP